ncbi:MAG: hypothetical protein N2Z20_05815 [Elusimicrobiales bacterium]|nr:hypothetical protein [Elusimicrobiales bacterium]
MKYINPVIIFLIMIFISDFKKWLILFFLLLLLISFISFKSLRFSGGVKVWSFLIIFLILMSFELPEFSISHKSVKNNFKIFLHFYSFCVLINYINDNLALRKIYNFLMKYHMSRYAFYILFIFVVFKKISVTINDIFKYYSLENRGLKFIKMIDRLIYCCIRETSRVAFGFSESFILRRIYEEEK